MSLYDYRWSLEAAKHDPPFYGLLMAAIRKADSINIAKLRAMWPELVDEFTRRYNAGGGILPEDGPQSTCCLDPECEDCPGACPVHGEEAPGG